MKRFLESTLLAVLFILMFSEVSTSQNGIDVNPASISTLSAIERSIAAFRWNRPLSEQWLKSVLNKKFSFSENLESAPKFKKVEVVSSAYYRPLKKQKKFARGSYRKDIRMNGSGVTYCLGTPPRIGTIAADLTLFKPGTILEIPGYGYGTVEDIGKAIKGRRIDIFMGEGDHACEKALEWGMKTIQVKVIYSG